MIEKRKTLNVKFGRKKNEETEWQQKSADSIKTSLIKTRMQFLNMFNKLGALFMWMNTTSAILKKLYNGSKFSKYWNAQSITV